MFNTTTIKQDESVIKKWKEEYKRLYGRKQVNRETESGIPLKPIYTASDIGDTDYGDIGLPGVYPYTRGNFPLGFQFRDWANQQLHGYGLAEHTRERMEFLRGVGGTKWQEGMESFAVVADIPSQFGYDPDEPEARGRAGVCGVSIATIEDWAILWDGIDLNKMHLDFVKWETACLPIMAIHIAYAESKGVGPEKLMASCLNAIPSQWYMDYANYPVKSCLLLCTEYVKFCTENMPRVIHTTLDEYEMREAGCNAVQSLAFSFATSIALAEEYIRAGIKPDDFMHGFIFHLSMGLDFFEEIAKVRALRRVWARISKERFGCSAPRSWRARVYVDCQGSVMTRKEPLNNIVRSSLETLAAVLGGVTSIETCPYDEVIGLPTEEAERVAVRTGQIILYETGVPNVSDPLAGSYYVEWLTNKIDEEIMKIVRTVDEIGFVKCYESGWFRQQRLETLYKKGERLKSGKQIVVGVNKYTSDDSDELNIEQFEYPPDVDKLAVQRIKKFKKERDNAKTSAALEDITSAAELVLKERVRGDLMWALIAAAKAGATMGEMTGILRKVFGWTYL